jgi:hypothetical protein
MRYPEAEPTDRTTTNSMPSQSLNLSALGEMLTQYSKEIQGSHDTRHACVFPNIRALSLENYVIQLARRGLQI